MDVKTFDIQSYDSNRKDPLQDPLQMLRKESTERMRTALLSCSLDDNLGVAAAIKQVTILRVSHQVARIVQYLDMMDKIEEKLYQAIDIELQTADLCDPTALNHLLVIQTKLQEIIIESNKLLAPYLNMEQYPAFENIETVTPVDSNIIDLPADKRNALRENAGAILAELDAMSQQPEIVQ